MTARELAWRSGYRQNNRAGHADQARRGWQHGPQQAQFSVLPTALVRIKQKHCGVPGHQFLHDAHTANASLHDFDAGWEVFTGKTPGQLDTKAVIAVQHIAHAHDQYFGVCSATHDLETGKDRGEIHIESDQHPTIFILLDGIARDHLVATDATTPAHVVMATRVVRTSQRVAAKRGTT